MVRRRHAVPNALLPTHHADLPQPRLRRRRGDHDRDGVLHPRSRLARPSRRWQGPTCRVLQATVPAVLRPRSSSRTSSPTCSTPRSTRGCAHERAAPDDRRTRRGPRSTSRRRPARSPARVVWARRRRAWRIRVPREPRRACSGSSSWSSSSSSRSSRRCCSDSPSWTSPQATGGVLRAAVAGVPAGHRRLRPHVLALVVWGARISLLVGFVRDRHLDGHRHAWSGSRRATTADSVGGAARPAHRLVPRHPVPAAGDRARHRARPEPAEHHHRHRHHLLARHRTADPRADAVGRGPAVPGAGPRPRRRQRAPDEPARAAQRDAAGAREHDARRVDLDPVRDDAVLPRARRPDRGLVGLDPRGRVRRRRDLRRAPGGTWSRPGSASSWSCCAFTLVGRALEDILDPHGCRSADVQWRCSSSTTCQ